MLQLSRNNNPINPERHSIGDSLKHFEEHDGKKTIFFKLPA